MLHAGCVCAGAFGLTSGELCGLRQFQLEVDASQQGDRRGILPVLEYLAGFGEAPGIEGRLGEIILRESQEGHNKKNGHFAQHTACGNKVAVWGQGDG